MSKTYTKAQSFPNPDSQIISNQSDQLQLNEPRISADRLFKILDASIFSQKIGIKLAIETISPTKTSNSDFKFINCYLNSTSFLLEACKNVQLRLEKIRNCLDNIPIGLNYLESEHEPTKSILQQAAIAFEDSRFGDKKHCNKVKKNISKMRKFGKKLNFHTLACDDTNECTISLDLIKALSESWEMAVNAVEMLSSATSFKSLAKPSVKSLAVEPQTILLNKPDKKIKKKMHKDVSMEELESAELISQRLLKLISAWQKYGSSNLRRMAVNTVAGELRRRREVLEKILPLLESKIEEFYQQIVAVRISLFGLIATNNKEDVLEIVNHCQSSLEESCLGRVKVQTKSFSKGQIRYTAWSSFTTRVSNQVL